MNKNVDIFKIFPWDTHFETGIDKIDEQHKKLVDILNRLAAYQANLAKEEDLNKVFDELVEYADYHFKTEEGIWSQYFLNDEWYKAHENTHNSFLGAVLKIKNDPNKTFNDTIYELILFLSKWLAFHILDTDKRMAKVVLHLQEGYSLEESKQHSNDFMNGSIQALIDAVLKMYGDISSRTLDLMREKALRTQAQEALLKSEEKWRFILNSSGENIWDYDIEHEHACISTDDCKVDEILHSGLEKFDFFSQVHPEDMAQVREDFKAHLAGKTEFYHNKHRVLRKDGGWTWILSRGKVLERDDSGVAKRIIGIHSDITEKELSSIIYQNSSQGMFISDRDNHIISINPAFTEITQYEKGEVIGKNPTMLSVGEADENFYEKLWSDIIKNGHWHGEVVTRRKNGELYVQDLKINVVKNAEGKIDHYIGFFSDISERKKSEKIILKQANFDSLTDLENRRMFTSRLSEAISISRRSKKPFAVLFINLDHFKDINDTLGHVSGDSILIEVASRIKNEIRDSDVLARFGGDEFTLILPEIKNANAIDRIAQNIIDKIKKPFNRLNSTFYLSASIGITIYPDDGADESTLLRNADQAMHQAKLAGRSRFNYFTEHMQIMAQKRHKTLHDLHKAIDNEEFEVYYQPIVDVKTNKVVKAEALVRWNHPTDGLIFPNDFIPLAEETGMIVEIGDQVYKQAVLQVHQWKEKYNIDFKVSVNKSPAQFKIPHTLDGWMGYNQERGIDARDVIIEITENLLMQENDIIFEQLLRLKDAGIEVAIDDFGTGYSSFAYLKKFDIDYLKIDKSFVDNVAFSEHDKVLCEAMIAMAHKLGIRVIAEGVESELQKQILTEMECDFIQGYIYSKPIPADKFETLFLV